MATFNQIPQEHQDAILAFKAKHGRHWKNKLYIAWDRDTREQWGLLREVRNNWIDSIHSIPKD